MDSKEFRAAAAAAAVERRREGLCAGPVYDGNGRGSHSPWHDQYFGRGIVPSGSVDCEEALAVGSTMNGLLVGLRANHFNSGPVVFAAGATVTLSLSQGDAPDGDFEEVGPTVCVKAPAAGLEVEPDCLALRFAIGDFQKHFLRVKLEFAGSVSGGKLDCCLMYAPR